jgi:hypothetical protein
MTQLYPQALGLFSSLPAICRATVQAVDPTFIWAVIHQNCTAVQSQSQSHFATGGLQSISSSWRQVS